MNEPNATRPVRKVPIADHIWDAFEQMAVEMGSDRDGLINQAMFMFARLNGFLGATAPASNLAVVANAPAAAGRANGAARQAPPPRVAPPMAEPEPEAAEDELEPPPAHDDEFAAHDEAEPEAAEEAEASPADATPLPAPAPAPARRTAAPVVARDSKPRPTEAAMPVAADDNEDEPAKLDDDPVRREVAERVLETAAELERLIKGKQAAAAAPPPPPAPAENTGATPAPGPAGDKALYIMGENGELDKVVKERFLIGRGKHCDFVINSGKVSREHAAVTHEADGWYIEDLGSSNGTWFNKQRIKRRKIEDGDEFFICSEKMKCVLR